LKAQAKAEKAAAKNAAKAAKRKAKLESLTPAALELQLMKAKDRLTQLEAEFAEDKADMDAEIAELEGIKSSRPVAPC